MILIHVTVKLKYKETYPFKLLLRRSIRKNVQRQYGSWICLLIGKKTTTIRNKLLTKNKIKNRQQFQQILTCKADFVGTRNFMTAGSPANTPFDFASSSNVWERMPPLKIALVCKKGWTKMQQSRNRRR